MNTISRWLARVAWLAAGGAFFLFWYWVLPTRLDFEIAAIGEPYRWIAALPSILGFTVGLRCISDFATTGHGTPAPIAPPRRLVVVGFYRHVRNPMYSGFFVGWLGLWVVLGATNRVAIAVACLVTVGAFLFVIEYEEPTLRKLFGAEYEEYCRAVPRWMPRFRPWTK
jgi:protein-S-isoprenylcysteine O-methyltransferase Ste14